MEAHVDQVEGEERVVLALTREELFLLAGAMNEAIEAVEDWEFSTRMGADKQDAKALRSDLRKVISTLPPTGS